MKLTLLALVALSLTGFSWGCSEDGKSGFLPKNDMYIPVGTKSINGGLTQTQFNTVINEVKDLYASEIASLGGTLVMNRVWADGEVNASAERQGKKWIVNMTGGLARHEAITPDGLALVVCHELGHHIGGAPKKKLSLNVWSSAEGQSDYFAALKCLRRLFVNDNNAAIVKTLKAPAFLVAACTKAHSKEDALICIRTGMAGTSVAGLFQSLSGEKVAQFNTPDKKLVAATYEKHPATQCRLDTFFQGALCEKGMNESVSQSDEVRGTCHRTTGHRIGVRPACWFKTK